ncbi:MAG TPA: Holliday junction resolvase RuvX [Candidatus Limnocylindrales bacterium]|nr:Holliday junction resolvase RuvX [Candidatus Limnocylindrales bacterium]
MTRLLGIDLGERRIGLAVAEIDREPSLPLATIRRGRSVAADAERLATVVREQRIDELVIGLPLEASGAEGTMAGAARAWAASIGAALGLPVALRDERLSSHRAEDRLGPMPRGRSGGPPTPTQREAYRARVDREAAAIILADELEARAAGGPATAGAPR